jgi:hypothetical protein
MAITGNGFRLDSRSIPPEVLEGRVPYYRSVYAQYKARFIQELFRLLNKSFWTRAKGNADSGIQWKKLASRTVQDKRKLRDEHGYDEWSLRYDGYNDDGTPNYEATGLKTVELLSPRDQMRYRREYRIAYEELTQNKVDKNGNITELSELASNRINKATARKKAAARAWLSIETTNPNRDNIAKLINIRTGKLVGATVPGTVSNGKYYPARGQQFEMTEESITITLKHIVYAGEVDVQREIIPDNIGPWIELAHNAIITEIEDMYASLKASAPSRGKSIETQSRIERTPRDQSRRDYDTAGDEVPF